MQDIIDQLTDTIRTAAASKMPLCIRGGGSKDFYGGPLRGEALEIGGYRGIVDYDPTELVFTARAGTPLAEIEAVLREKGQMLAFEPPHFGIPPSPLAPLPQAGEGNVVPASPDNRMATLGGCIAAGLSGPRRPYTGAARDFVLGVRMLDGTGNDLRFGGQVMKNVAGFDVSRLMAGSLGTLGVILEVSLKMLPLPAVETTLRLAQTAAKAIALVNEWAAQPLPVSATAWTDGNLVLRLSAEAAARFWHGVREHTDPFFNSGQPLWRLSLKSTTPPLNLPGTQLIEWGGALRWLATGADARTVRAAAALSGGHATLFRASDKSAGVFQPLPPALQTIHRKLKQTFDPAGIFNPGRMYDWM
ncbi:MAG: glycolate oxidase subunit GlcE [Betaproteobacteria bacterium]|nr:glycolate oxidase subunit GlcE [Betaproteobacteria bacterium]